MPIQISKVIRHFVCSKKTNIFEVSVSYFFSSIHNVSFRIRVFSRLERCMTVVIV